MPSLSIIIPTLDKAPRLKLTLACLASQTPKDNFELIIVNNGCTDETESVIEEMTQFLPIKQVYCQAKGRAAARNYGARTAKGTILLFLDDDILTGPNFAQQHVLAQTAHAGFVHGHLKELIGLTRIIDPAHGGPGTPPFNYLTLASQGFFPNNCRITTNILEQTVALIFDNKTPVYLPWLAGVGANFSIPKLLWEKTGGFNEGFSSVWGCEDLEFALRLHSQNLPFSLSHSAIGYHLSHIQENRWTNHTTNLNYFVQLHPLPEVMALPYLLGPNGNIEDYFNRVLQLQMVLHET